VKLLIALLATVAIPPSNGWGETKGGGQTGGENAGSPYGDVFQRSGHLNPQKPKQPDKEFPLKSIRTTKSEDCPDTKRSKATTFSK